MKIEEIKKALTLRLASLPAQIEEKPVESKASASVKPILTSQTDCKPAVKKKAEKVAPATFLSATQNASTSTELKKSEHSQKIMLASQLPPKPVAVKPARKTRTATTDIETIVAQNLKVGVDFTVIPGCGNKPSLLKAGAEHLAQLLNFKTRSEIVNRVTDLDKNFILYEVATTVYNAKGEVTAVGLGSCCTFERRYIKQGFNMSLNTVLKMARKRSYVDAILSASGSSRIFTQDIEELESNIIAFSAKEQTIDK